MADFITLTCPACGSEHRASGDANCFVCPACKNEYLIDNSDNELSLRPVPTQLANADQARDVRITKKAIASTKRSITHLNKKIKDTRTGIGLLAILFALGLGGISIVLGLVSISNFIEIDDKSVTDVENMLVCGIVPIIGGAFFLFLWFVWREADKGNLKELEARLVQKQQDLAEHQSLLSASEQPNPKHDEPA